MNTNIEYLWLDLIKGEMTPYYNGSIVMTGVFVKPMGEAFFIKLNERDQGWEVKQSSRSLFFSVPADHWNEVLAHQLYLQLTE